MRGGVGRCPELHQLGRVFRTSRQNQALPRSCRLIAFQRPIIQLDQQPARGLHVSAVQRLQLHHVEKQRPQALVHMYGSPALNPNGLLFEACQQIAARFGIGIRDLLVGIRIVDPAVGSHWKNGRFCGFGKISEPSAQRHRKWKFGIAATLEIHRVRRLHAITLLDEALESVSASWARDQAHPRRGVSIVEAGRRPWDRASENRRI